MPLVDDSFARSAEQAIVIAEAYVAGKDYFSETEAEAASNARSNDHADVAAFAAAAAAANALRDPELCIVASASAANHALAAAEDLTRDNIARHVKTAQIADFQRLLELTGHQAGIQGDPIDLNELGSVWTDESMQGWQTEWTEKRLGQEPIPSGDSELVIEIQIPDGVSDEETIKQAKELILLANAFHHSLGGKGLALKDLTVFDRSPSPIGGRL
ncbi:MAG: hypothetical protein KDA57_19500 [Planctomycetales bacterium]|nr:hypothetical protein [Planctomycetales bacterium]